MTLVVLSKPSKPESAAKPSSGWLGRGGRPEVEYCYSGMVRSECLDSLGAVSRQQDFVVLTDRPLHLSTDLLVVVDDEQFRFHEKAGAS